MEKFSIVSNDDQIIITIDRTLVDINLVNNLVKHLQTEQLIRKANFSKEILDVGNEIKKEWWKKNKKNYLKGI